MSGAALVPLLPPTPVFGFAAEGGAKEPPTGRAMRAMVSAPLGSCPLHVRGGKALPLHRHGTSKRRQWGLDGGWGSLLAGGLGVSGGLSAAARWG